MQRLFLLILLMLPFNAMAQDIVIKEEYCQKLTEYKQAEGVEYQPGVDVNGRAVVPADMQTNRIQPPEVIEFNIAVDVAEYIGIPTQPGIENFANVGTIQVVNNQLFFNGEPLKTDSEQALLALCENDEDKTDEPNKTKTAKIPRDKPKSPTRLTTNAFIAAAFAECL